MRLEWSQRSSCASSQTLAIVISSLAPGAAATKYWNADERAEQPQPGAADLLGQPLLERALRVDRDRPQVVGELRPRSRRDALAARTRARRGPARRPRRRSSAGPPARPPRPSAAATVVLPTPPLPVTYSSRRSRSSASIEDGRMTMHAMDPAITAAYETCRRLQRRHDPTYYWATRRLPAAVRPATHALYGYVRTADEIVDGPRRPPTPDARRAALDAWEASCATAAAGARAPGGRARCVDAGERHDLPLDELGPYMRSMRVDCAPVRIASWDELERLHGRLGRLGRPDHGAAARRAARAAGRLRPPRPGVPARELHPRRRARTCAPRPRSTCPRPIASASASPRPALGERARRPSARSLANTSPAPARCSPLAAPAVAAAPASVRPGIRLGGRRLRDASSIAPRPRASTCWGAGRAWDRWHLPRDRPAGARRPAGRTLRGAERTPLAGEPRAPTC